MKPAITTPGANEMRMKCSKVRSAVTLREEEEEEEEEDEEEEECDLTMISDTEETVISMSQVKNVRIKPCKLVGIEPRLSSIVTLYSETETEEKNTDIVFPSQQTQPVDGCGPSRPEIPEDFVPRCGR